MAYIAMISMAAAPYRKLSIVKFQISLIHIYILYIHTYTHYILYVPNLLAVVPAIGLIYSRVYTSFFFFFLNAQ